MRINYRALSVVLAAGVLALSAVGCVCTAEKVEIVDMMSESHSIDLEGAEHVRVVLEIGIGDLEITGGASDALLEADFTYNVAEWKPEISYEVSDGDGILHVRQPSTGKLSITGRAKNHWELALNENVPMTMSLEMGVGEASLDLGGLDLSDLTVDHGVGELRIDLTGHVDDDLFASIDGGVGKIELSVPYSVGVRIDADTGIGGLSTRGFSRRKGVLTNDAYGTSDVTLDIDIDSGIGGISVISSDTTVGSI